MNTQNQQQPRPALVKASAIAEALAVTPRYVGILTAKGEIPCHRLSKRCIRYSLPAVLSALRIDSAK